VFGWKSGESAWQQACEEADRLDPGWRWEDLLSRKSELPADRDARQVALSAAALLPEGWPDWIPFLEEFDLVPKEPPKDNEDLEDFSSFVQMRHQAAERFETELEFGPRNLGLSETTKRVLHAALVDRETPYRLARSIIDLEVGRASESTRPIILNLPDFVPSRRAAKLLQLEARVAAEDGRIDDAIADAAAMLTLSTAACEPPMLITILMGFAIRNMVAASIERSLAQGEASPAVLEKTQNDVEAAAMEQILLLGMRGERAINEDYVRAVEAGIVSAEQITEFEATPSLFLNWWRSAYIAVHRWLFPGFSKRQQAGVIRYYSTIVELLKDSQDSLKRLSELLGPLRTSATWTVQFTQSGAEKLFCADFQQRAKLHAVATALAVERFRMKHKTWPKQLSDLIPEYLSNVPHDPFALNPMRYARTVDGVVVYSLGHDEVDSGGDIHSGEHRPPDIGVRLWNPEHRHSEPQGK
jgi:hypothetical protein